MNAVFHEPLERQAALKLVRATQMLVLQMKCCYIRIPIITGNFDDMADSREFHSHQPGAQHGWDVGQKPRSTSEHGAGFVRLIRTRPHPGAATVSWRKPDKTFGVRFDVKYECCTAHQRMDRSLPGKFSRQPSALSSTLALSRSFAAPLCVLSGLNIFARYRQAQTLYRKGRKEKHAKFAKGIPDRRPPWESGRACM